MYDSYWQLLPIRIRDPVLFCLLDPGSRMSKIKIRTGNEHLGSSFRELENNFLG
jgi:hypothetical protein